MLKENSKSWKFISFLKEKGRFFQRFQRFSNQPSNIYFSKNPKFWEYIFLITFNISTPDLGLPLLQMAFVKLLLFIICPPFYQQAALWRGWAGSASCCGFHDGGVDCPRALVEESPRPTVPLLPLSNWSGHVTPIQ